MVEGRSMVGRRVGFGLVGRLKVGRRVGRPWVGWCKGA